MQLFQTSNFHDSFQRIGMRPHGWQLSFLNSPVIAQIALKPIEALSFIKWGLPILCFMSETALQSFDLFYASK